jgi:hypothetical protein
MRKSPTFKDVLKGLEATHSRRVIERAALANRIAKVADAPASRRRAYRAKTRAIEHGIEKFPDAFALSSAEDGGRVLGVRFRHERAFHVLARDLSHGSRAWVAREGARLAATYAAEAA